MSKTDLETALVARKTKQIELLPKVKIFLDSIARKSIKSNRSYSSGITLLQNFLNENQQKYQHIRKEYTKTKVSRDVYISDEATNYLKQWIDWKYRDKTKEKEKGTIKSANLEDLVFSTYSIINKGSNPYNLYVTLFKEFSKLLILTGMAERKESGIQKRRKITLHNIKKLTQISREKDAEKRRLDESVMGEVIFEHLHHNKGYYQEDLVRVTKEKNIFKERGRDFYELCGYPILCYMKLHEQGLDYPDEE